MKSLILSKIIIAVSISIVYCTLSIPAFAFTAKEHRTLTIFAFQILEEMYPVIFQSYLQLSGEDSLIRNMSYENISYVPARPPENADLVERVAWEALAPDYYRDLEFVDVDGEMDDPHENISWEDSDEAGYSTRDDLLIGTLEAIFGREHSNFAAFNHFINIASYGKSVFDDYDGYSYQFIKEHGNQYQRDARLFGEVLDTGIMWYYNDEYVHIPGQRWYNACSPGIERYSYSTNYPTAMEEATARFPLAKDTGSKGCGIPYSTFFPVDNLARCWYGRFLQTNDPLDLGPVMHAIGDASIPHHAAGYLGNWHQAYESEIGIHVVNVINSESAREKIMKLLKSWDRIDGNIPKRLLPDDYMKIPAINWDVEDLVTWIALIAYQQYIKVYEPYYRSNGKHVVDDERARELIIFATAMKVLVLKKAMSGN